MKEPEEKRLAAYLNADSACLNKDEKLIRKSQEVEDPCIHNNVRHDENSPVADELKRSNDAKIISLSNWRITLTSENGTLKKNDLSWEISTRNEKSSSKGNISIQKFNFGPIGKVNAEIHCNCDELENQTKDSETDQDHGSILLKQYLQLLTNENARISFILKILANAINEHKLFVISGCFSVLRKPLRKRGWLEKRSIRKMLSMSPDFDEASGLEMIEKLLKSPADLIWYTNKKSMALRTGERTIVNKFVKCYFTSKVDMCNNLETTYWFYEPGVSNVQFPRCYNVYRNAEIAEFVQDFYLTACMGILKWYLMLASIAGTTAIWSKEGTVPINAILFALERCVEYINMRNHEDIDREVHTNIESTSWLEFLRWHKKAVNDREVLEENEEIKIDELVKYMGSTLKKMMEYRPQSFIDGTRNVWILKPGDKSLGRGIILKNSLSGILQRINQAARENTQYVVQKYIERPLLVYKTKIDVRQWFLITSTHPLILWMYKDVLIRFASRDFTLDSFHESIHLCNTTVQLKYRESVKANSQLPNELHWNLQNFKEYLRATNRESAWEKLIKPGIKENLIGALLASQENMMNRKNSFQLYGADFVIVDDLSVWLIEINTNPRLHPPTSSVTEKLYPEVIEDTIKVVLDRRKNKKAPSGKFERIYNQRNPFSGIVLGQGANLSIRGTSLLPNPRPSRQVGCSTYISSIWKGEKCNKRQVG